MLVLRTDPSLWSYGWWKDIGATAVTGGAAVVVSLAALVVAVMGQRQAARAERHQRDAERRMARAQIESLIEQTLAADHRARRPTVMHTVPNDPGRQAIRQAHLAVRDALRRLQAAIAVLQPGDADGAKLLFDEVQQFTARGFNAAPDVARDRARVAAAITAAASDWVRRPHEFAQRGVAVFQRTLREIDAPE